MKIYAKALVGCMLLSTLMPCSAATSSDNKVSSKTSLEGEKVRSETIQMQGIEMQQALSEDGTELIQRPYKWYAGIGTADNKQVAIEVAQREAYATISRILNNAVYDEAEKGSVANNGKVKQALKSHWEQVSSSLVKACEPYGSATVEYNPTTKMYTAVAKVGIRGDRFNKLLKKAGEFKPANLTDDELDLFMETNESILDAAKGD